MVLDGIVRYEGEGEGTGFSGSAGAHSPGSSTARIRLICCHLTAGGKEACIDNPADIHQTANHSHVRGIHDYQHVLKSIRLAEEAGHNNVIIGGDYNMNLIEWARHIPNACRELRCKRYTFLGDTDECHMAVPECLIDGQENFITKYTTMPRVEGGTHPAFYVRIAFQLDQVKQHTPPSSPGVVPPRPPPTEIPEPDGEPKPEPRATASLVLTSPPTLDTELSSEEPATPLSPREAALMLKSVPEIVNDDPSFSDFKSNMGDVSFRLSEQAVYPTLQFMSDMPPGLAMDGLCTPAHSGAPLPSWQDFLEIASKSEDGCPVVPNRPPKEANVEPSSPTVQVEQAASSSTAGHGDGEQEIPISHGRLFIGSRTFPGHHWVR